jgi:hypothetical protein
MRKSASFLPMIVATLFSISNSQAQEQGVAVSAQQVEFSRPKLVENVGAGAIFAARFECDSDGTIYAHVLESKGDGDPMLLAMHPDGTSTSFSAQLPSFTAFSTPESVFVGYEKVYILVSAQSISPNPGDAARRSVVLIFDRQGTLIHTVQVEQDVRPLVIGAFSSGHILLGSEDRLNHRLALTLVDENGTYIREMSLHDSDIVARAASLPRDSGPGSYSAMLLIGMSQLIPSGDNLLLVPLVTSGLPIVELGEGGVINSLVPKMPDGKILNAFLGSDSTTFKVQMATMAVSHGQGNDAGGKTLGVGVRPLPSVAEISRTNGSILKEIALGGNQVQPACEADGVLHLLTASEERLQVTTAVLY